MRTLLTLLSIAVLAASVTADDIAVTVYNSNLGVISELRSLEFVKGVGRLAFTDVPSRIDPASVRFDMVGKGGDVTILEQNYAYDLVNPQQMYTRYIDEEIELIDKEGKLYSGTLLSSAADAVVLMEESGKIKIIRLEHILETSFPSLPEGLITRPTLFWTYSSEAAGKYDARVGYQTSGMNWSAEYVGVLSPDEKNLDLSGWASIDNNSGKTYKDATLKLVAGDIHRAERPGRGMAVREVTTALDKRALAGFEEKAFFEYHLYTLPRKATLADKENKQISLFEPAKSTVEKLFIYRPERNPTKVEVAVKFTNSEETGLGMPLPAGRVRLFKADDDGSMILLGEDLIDHTPKDEEVKLQVGHAFDITAEEKVVTQSRISPKVEEKDFEIELSNHKEDPVVVEIEKKLWGFWDVMDSSIEYEKKDASTIIFQVPLQPDESSTVKFKVRYYLR
ncbi:MAG: DUF4139 domain-containing protein [Candidatus Zixiibacteriota bacterium]|nr:MAG: DUF4139 domain-containing protein [candidate division Zixibacteria bacterium]